MFYLFYTQFSFSISAVADSVAVAVIILTAIIFKS